MSDESSKQRGKVTEEAVTRDPEQVRHERRVEWWSKVWVPLCAASVAFLAGMGTCAGSYFQRDVRNQVWEATHEDKERVLKTQSDLLKLQEDYIGKLKQVHDSEIALQKAQDELRSKQVEAEAVREQSQQAIAALRAHYAQLQSAENARLARLAAEKAANLARAAENKAAAERRGPWEHYGCNMELVLVSQKNSNCYQGYRATFAADTPDQKEVVSPSTSCLTVVDQDIFRRSYERCTTYALAFLARKGVSAEDAKAIQNNYYEVHGLEALISSLYKITGKPTVVH